MKVAIPINHQGISQQFEECACLQVFEITNMSVSSMHWVDLAEGSDGIEWIVQNHIDDVIAVRMLRVNMEKLIESKVNVYIGMPCRPPVDLVEDFLEGCLVSDGRAVK